MDRLEKPGIEPSIPGLQGEGLIHYTMAVPASTSDMDQDTNFGTYLICAIASFNFPFWQIYLV